MIKLILLSNFHQLAMNQSFLTLENIITTRRTTKPAQMNGRKIPDEQVRELLKLANWAPTHGRTEPWRFMVFSETRVQRFCEDHARLYKTSTPEESFVQGTYNNLKTMGDKASHVIIAIMQRGSLPKIPVWEEQASVAAAVENILLGATAMGIASYWGTGGMIQHQAMKDFLKLRPEDFVMGAIYLGYSDTENPAIRASSIDDKTVWA